MSASNAQQIALANSLGFQGRVRASIIKKALSIIENQGSYTPQQVAKAQQMINGVPGSYSQILAGSTNVVASNISYDFVSNAIVSDISDADPDSQIYTVVFNDLL